MYTPYQHGYGSPYGNQLAQNRLTQMEQQYNQQQMYNQMYNNPMPQMQQTAQTQYIKGRPVSSFDEAKAVAIDWDGSIFVFTDVANKRIYTKQIMLDGTAELKTYVLEESAPSASVTTDAQTTSVNGDYVLRSDFESQIKALKDTIEELKKGGVVDESTRSNVKSNVRK